MNPCATDGHLGFFRTLMTHDYCVVVGKFTQHARNSPTH
jgi:hypothetical protein